MSLRIYNTRSGQKEEFIPLESGKVLMYVCGLTPKNYPHVGHARLFIVNDMIRRYLEYRGYAVTYIQNFTDVEDKIIEAGHRDGLPPHEVAKKYTAAYFENMDALNVRHADIFTKATEYIPSMIKTIATLIERGFAYAVPGGDIFYQVSAFPRYGELSHRSAEDVLAGARIDIDEKKTDPRDFALWKAAKAGEPAWESPWGKGRPGWHIECSTMIIDTLGPTIDIHGGGADLIFPHHENEIAQSEAYTGVHPFVRYWVHTGFVKNAEEKMAHSGTFTAIRDVLKTTKPDALRYFLIRKYYRDSIDYTEGNLAADVKGWERLSNTRATITRLLNWAQEIGQTQQPSSDTPTIESTPTAPVSTTLLDDLQAARKGFISAMEDDFNTAAAVAVLFELSKRINEYADMIGKSGLSSTAIVSDLQEAGKTFDELLDVLGLKFSIQDSSDRSAATDEIEAMITERNELRKNKQYADADRVRLTLEEIYRVVIKDTPQGTTWQYKSDK